MLPTNEVSATQGSRRSRSVPTGCTEIAPRKTPWKGTKNVAKLIRRARAKELPFVHIPIIIRDVTPEVQRLVDIAEAIAQNAEATKMNDATSVQVRAVPSRPKPPAERAGGKERQTWES
jgi:hypothetical protein